MSQGKHAEVKENKTAAMVSNIIFAIVILFFVTVLATILFARAKGEDPTLFGYRFYFVESGSMTPAIPVGSLVVDRDTKVADIKVGDVITFRVSGNMLVTHRVAMISPDGQSFVTRGDANNTEDAMPVTKDNLMGKVIAHLPNIGYLMQFLKKPAGIATVVGIIVLVIALSIGLKILRRPKTGAR